MTGAGRVTWPGLLKQAICYALAVVQDVTPEMLQHPTPCRGWDVQMLLRHASESLAALREGIDAGRIGLDPSPEDLSGDSVQLFRDRATELLRASATVATGPAERPTGPLKAPDSPAGAPDGPAEVPNGSAGEPDGLTGEPDGLTGEPDGLTGEPDGPAGAPNEPAEVANRPAGEPDGPAIVAVADQCITLAVLADAGALELAVHGWDLSWACGRREPIPSALATGLLPVSALLVPRAGRHPLFGPPVAVPQLASPSDHLVAYLGRNPK
jgi:Mycothiol maleylpyruvate isomerase N-terminal domain